MWILIFFSDLTGPERFSRHRGLGLYALCERRLRPGRRRNKKVFMSVVRWCQPTWKNGQEWTTCQDKSNSGPDHSWENCKAVYRPRLVRKIHQADQGPTQRNHVGSMLSLGPKCLRASLSLEIVRFIEFTDTVRSSIALLYTNSHGLAAYIFLTNFDKNVAYAQVDASQKLGITAEARGLHFKLGLLEGFPRDERPLPPPPKAKNCQICTIQIFKNLFVVGEA